MDFWDALEGEAVSLGFKSIRCKASASMTR